MRKSFFRSFLALSAAFLLVSGCAAPAGSSVASSGEGSQTSLNDLPQINISWGNDMHTALLEVALDHPESFKKQGTYLEKISENKFLLFDENKEQAVLNYIATKGGSENAALMGQGHLDSALTSNTALLTGIDKGTDIKILSPLQTGGMSLVFDAQETISGWEAVKEKLKNHPTPFKIGYHSPVSGPRILLESILRDNGVTVTEDPGDAQADVLLVDLKGQNNLLPALPSKNVDGWVGPSLSPELAEQQKVGKIVLKLEDFPPAGKWTNFPCCVFGVTEKSFKEHPEIYRSLVKLIQESALYATDHPEEKAQSFARIIGAEPETVKLSNIRYTTDPSEDWLDGIKVYVKALNEMGKFEGRLKGLPFEEVKAQAFDFGYLDASKSAK